MIINDDNIVHANVWQLFKVADTVLVKAVNSQWQLWRTNHFKECSYTQ